MKTKQMVANCKKCPIDKICYQHWYCTEDHLYEGKRNVKASDCPLFILSFNKLNEDERKLQSEVKNG